MISNVKILGAIALAVAGVAWAAAPQSTYASSINRQSYISPASRMEALEGAPLSQAIPLKMSLVDQDDPEAMGACIHTVSSYKMCNDITRRYCFSAMFAKATFLEGMTCQQAKDDGYY